MAMVVLLLDDVDAEFCVRQELVSDLARLGVTSLTLVRDQHTLGVVLEGWLFDPGRSVAVAAEAVGAASGARTLHQLMHLAPSGCSLDGTVATAGQAPASSQGGSR